MMLQMHTREKRKIWNFIFSWSLSKTLISPREGRPLALARGATKSLTPKNAERRRQMLNCE